MTIKLVESNLDTDHYVLRVRHYHKGNSSSRQRHGHRYYTEARILDKETYEEVGFGSATCSNKDLPSRATGRRVAVGRAMLDVTLNEHSLTSLGELY